MERQEYLLHVDACLQRVARWLDGLDPEEIDFSTGDGLLQIEFGDGTRFVLNRQTPASQMWFAAGARAWHYDFDPAHDSWVDDRDRHDLYARLAEVVATKLGHPVPAA